jgi:hypothetical protein
LRVLHTTMAIVKLGATINAITSVCAATSTRRKFAIILAFCALVYILVLTTDGDVHSNELMSVEQASSEELEPDSSHDAAYTNGHDTHANEKKPDDKCGEWSYSLFMPDNSSSTASKRTTWKKNKLVNGIVWTDWTHVRSGAPSAMGVIHASVAYSRKSCAKGSNSFLNSLVSSQEHVLCSSAHATDGGGHQSTDSTAILSLTGRTNSNEAFPTTGVNLWHYHAAIFKLWAGLQLATTVAKADGLKTPTWIVALMPATAWSLMGFDSSYHVFFPSPANLLNITTDKTKYTIHGIQGLADVFGGRLILAHPETTIGELHKILEQNHAPTDIEMWFSPPEDGLMWDLAWDESLSKSLRQCQNSILFQFRNDLLSAVSSHEKPNIARHVCVVSRQGRGLRNLSPEFMLQLLGRLGGPLLLSPRTSLRTNTNTFDGVPLQLDMSSITGQLRFVHQECAVLLGVHGAGLTNALGLRQGTSVIELQTRSTSYQYFRNVAALMRDVDYSLVRIRGSGRSGKEEVDMYDDEKGLQQLYDLVESKLHESISRQAQHQNE